ncbi:MAG: hypothetical protein OXH57_13245 [Ekhidna sp.]|nr:hypothetical protein [Ekhidna sp.]
MRELDLKEMEKVEGGAIWPFLVIWAIGVVLIGEHNGWWDIF